MRFEGTKDYVADTDLKVAVNAAIALERPLLIKGEPGTGKTVLALEIAKSLGASEDKIAEGGLGKLAATSFERKYISKETFDRLNELRLMRIAYFHSHIGLNKRGAMHRYLEKRLYGVNAHRKDAAEALKIVHEFIHAQRAD